MSSPLSHCWPGFTDICCESIDVERVMILPVGLERQMFEKWFYYADVLDVLTQVLSMVK